MPDVHQGPFSPQQVCLLHQLLQLSPGPHLFLMHSLSLCVSVIPPCMNVAAFLLQGCFALALASSPSMFLSEPFTVTEHSSAAEESLAAGSSPSGGARRLARAESELGDPVPPAPPTPPSPPTPGGGFLCGHCIAVLLTGSCSAPQCKCTRAGCRSQVPGHATC